MVIGMTVSHYYLQNNLPKNPAECFCMYHINIQIELLEILIAFPRSKIQNYIHRSKLLILEICKYLHNQEKKQHWTGNEVVSFSNSRFVNCLVISIVHFPKAKFTRCRMLSSSRISENRHQQKWFQKILVLPNRLNGKWFSFPATCHYWWCVLAIKIC